MVAYPAHAKTSDDVIALQKTLAKQEALIKSQQQVLQEQTKKLEELTRKVDTGIQAQADQQTALLSLPKSTDEELKNAVGAGTPSKAEKNPAVKKAAETTATPAGTSITAPPKEEEKRPEVAVLPDVGGVLTPKGVLMYENSLEYVNTTSNLFTFNGVQVAEVVFIGVTNATTAKRQIAQDSNRLRLGLTDRWEADVRVPYVYRNDTTSETNTTTNTTDRTTLEGNGLGDIDGGMSYQLNNGKEGWPFLVANMRYKTNNADGPFDVPYDAESVATRLPTGTGFHSVEGSLTAIKVSDPAVLFANMGYVSNLSRDIDKTFGDTHVMEVDPGDAINISGGMGFSINPETSFTLGYKHSYVFETTQTNERVSTGVITDTESDTASVGALLVGASYRFNPITSLNFNVEVGATREAPDVRVGLRVPVRLGSLF
ncbi:MAG TPA: hypothetical protein DCY07_04665 [Rhodospirillaceae bacterium]|nr:hypothetical protein [Rhodospirillaceae bacterium]